MILTQTNQHQKPYNFQITTQKIEIYIFLNLWRENVPFILICHIYWRGQLAFGGCWESFVYVYVPSRCNFIFYHCKIKTHMFKTSPKSYKSKFFDSNLEKMFLLSYYWSYVGGVNWGLAVLENPYGVSYGDGITCVMFINLILECIYVYIDW